MRIDEIQISNYRQYRNISFKFPKSGIHDLHVIVAQNGIGKTNMLNAINWCLYNDEPHLGDKSKSLSILNLDAAREAKANGKDRAEIMVTISAEENGSCIVFSRRMIINVNTNIEYSTEFTVSINRKNQKPEILTDLDAEDYVKYFLPFDIREYFFFDGEQLHAYFKNKENTHVKKTVHTISQVNTVSEVKRKLGNIIKSKEANPTHKSLGYDEINKNIDHLEKQISEDKEEILVLKDQIAQSKETIARITELLRGQENLPELESERERLITNLKNSEKKEADLMKDMLKFVTNFKVRLSFYPIAEKVLALIKEKEKKNELPPSIDKNLLKEMVANHKCSICGHSLSPEEEDKINALIQKFSVSTNASHTLKEIEHKLEDVLSETKNYPELKEELLDGKRDLQKTIDAYKTRLSEIDEQLQGSDTEQIRRWAKERSDNEDSITTNNRKIGSKELNIKNNESELEKQRDLRLKLIDREKDNERISELIRFAKKAQKIVTEIETEMMTEIKDKIAISTSSYFKDLVWKKNTYEEVRLNDNYEIDLIHKCGDSCIGSCSAAERALLALSFTLALHQISGFHALLFIDTPVARVSDINRVNFAKVLNDVSKGKQIIMTFTPDEYSKDIQDVFEPNAATSQKLETVDERETRFKGGY